MTIHERKRFGYSLVEILCVMGLLIMVLGLLGSLLMETMGIERAQAESFERMAQHQALADQFRTDTALAEHAPPEWGAYKAGPHTLILQTKTGHVVYVWEMDKLERRDFRRRRTEHAIVLPVDASQVGVEFLRDAPVGGLIRLRLAALRDGGARGRTNAGNRCCPGRRLAMRLSFSRRPGVAIVTAIVVISVVTIILAVIAVQVFSQRMAARQRHNQLQAQWLARTGVEWAAARLLEKPDPFSEDQSGLVSDSRLHIVVEKTDDGNFLVTAEAEVGLEERPIVVRMANARFHRTEVDGVVRVQAY